MPTLETLPTELLLLLILELLPPRYFISFAQTNKRHYALCKSSFPAPVSKLPHYRIRAPRWTCITQYLKSNEAPTVPLGNDVLRRGTHELIILLLRNPELSVYVDYLELLGPKGANYSKWNAA
ncbi:hypothetical protein M501DRAFT_1013662 [Patellaria atrata CBS 101060]|uniref:F-box domain-containing protein n=1 Tax=Patellaria atrata CBS 101060 TaxID=1346257 RepID=A0A9P4VUA3_9PEZI|nr:hypothetical protein M501DRAFT_1013662 [Patellaria atrata CBS 101060]